MQVIAAKTQNLKKWPPLRERIVRANSNTDASILTPKPRGKTREWTEEQMERAMQDVTNGVLGVRRAALEYQVPRSTLSDRVTGKVYPGAAPGPPKYLGEEEEEELVKWIAGCAEIGYAKSVREIRAVVGAIVSYKLGLDSPIVVSHGWWDRFRQRHPHLVLRTGEGIAFKRLAAINKDTINHYYNLLEDTKKDNQLLNAPHLIFNCDETGMPLCSRPGKRVGVKGSKHIRICNSGLKTNITVLACTSAGGYVMPPFIIYQRKNLVESLIQGEIPGTMYGMNSNSGWMDGELFQQWFEQHFLRYAPATRPLLLLLDGHASHYSPSFIREAAGSGVIVFCLPPHTTHMCQPLDSACFSVLKKEWDRSCDTYMAHHPGKFVTIYQFSSIFAEAWQNAMTSKTVKASFKATGVYPFNRYAIDIPGEVNDKPIVTPTEKLAKRKGIKYIPFYTSPGLEKEIRSPSPEVDFSKEEMDLFAKRYEEGYDLFDERYNLWLQKYHPTDEVCKALFEEESEVTSREQTICTEETISWEEPTTSGEVSASGRVNSRKEVTMGEVPNTWNDKEVCEVISAV